MVIRRLLVGGAATLVALVIMIASVGAWHGESNPDYLTFSSSVALPGVILPAGTYTFARATWNDPNIVQVLSKDGRRVYFMGFTRPVGRPDGLQQNRLVTFREVAPGVPPPIAVWYPIGSSGGHQFVY